MRGQQGPQEAPLLEPPEVGAGSTLTTGVWEVWAIWSRPRTAQAPGVRAPG